jgi:serine/threonine protein phosphatase PrpC
VILKEALGDKPLETVEILGILRRTHLSINRQLAASAIDDSLSGTTAISCLIDGDMMYVSNVGDSRAILISSDENGKCTVSPLSNDQTPYRKDERERIKKTGARVLSMEQLEGIVPVHENWGDMKLGEEIDEAGDPPRVWSPYGDYPGTAFSRSIGDNIAKELGVVAEPEILARKISTNDKYVIIASDGVFEFLTNQMVADLILSKPDIFTACKAVVQQAYELWLRYEVRTDDITIIIIELQYDGCKSPFRTYSVDYVEPVIPTDGAKPVRRVMSREKRRSIIYSASAVESTEKEFEGNFSASDFCVEKSVDERKQIKQCIHGNILFQHLTAAMEEFIIGAVQHRAVEAGETVISQGEDGDSFYMISSGRFEARVRDSGAPETEPGDVVHVYEQNENSYPCFGELSLM